MIIVIADDLTGAAELAGLGLRHGLTVEVVTDIDAASQKGLVVIATDTRSMPESQALKIMAGLTVKIRALKPDLIYKKVDSVLRGHVIAELNIHLKELHLKSALLVPANLELGRTLSNGNYLLHGKPIHLSSFANDPEFPITGSDVRGMLGANGADVYIQKGNETLPGSGITIGECVKEEDFKTWVNKSRKDILLAGGSGFFNAILKSLYQPQNIAKNGFEFTGPSLFVCGSTFSKSKQLVKAVKNNNGPISYMPLEIIKSATPGENLFDQWADEIVSILSLHKKAIVAVDEGTIVNTGLVAGSLREKKARMLEKVFHRIVIKELLIEGGATASAIIKQLNFSKFVPVQELAPGVIRMKVQEKEGLHLTLKPGSYDWPPQIWNF